MDNFDIQNNIYYKISLQFFSDDEDDSEDDEDDENDGSEGEQDSGSDSHGSNPLVDRVRGKAQGLYNKSGARDKLNATGAKAGNAVEKAGNKLAGTTKGKSGDTAKNLGKIGNDKLSHLGDSVGDKIGGNSSGGEGKSVGEQATDKAIDKGADAASKVIEKGVEGAATGAGIPGGNLIGKAAGRAFSSFIKSPIGKRITKGCAIGCLGTIGFIIFIVIILYAFFGEVLGALGALLFKTLSSAVLMLTFHLFNLSFHTRVERQLDAIYKSVQEFEEVDRVDLEEGTKRSELENSTTKSDQKFSSDFAENIPRERMKRYVQAEYSEIFYLEDPSSGKKEEIDILTLYDALAKVDGNGGVSGTTQFANWLSDSNLFALFLPFLMTSPYEEDNINDALGTYKDSVNISYDLSSVDASIKTNLEQYLKESETDSEGTEKKVSFPENLDVILDEFPTAMSFFGPLEMSTGNPIIYGDEEIVVYSKYVQDEKGKINEAESIIDDKATAALKENIKKGDVITGNPSNVIMKLPNFYDSNTLQEEIDRLLGKTDFEDKGITRAFVMDIARLVYSNPQNNNRPTNITVYMYPDSTKATTTEIINVEYNGITYSIPKTTVEKTITPIAYIKKVEDWDRTIEYEYTETTSEPSTETILDSSGMIIGTRTVQSTSFTSAGPAKVTVTPYVQQLIDDYKLENYDFGIYYELTGRDFLDNETLYGTMSSQDYEAMFLDSGYCYPVGSLSEITSYYGYRNINGKNEFHTGIDLVNDYGTPILAFADGTVEEWATGKVRDPANGGYGNYIKLKHVTVNETTKEETTFYTVYAHLSNVQVSPLAKGTKVTAGQQIGSMGNTGRTLSSYSGPTAGTHLHFEIRNAAGETINPLDALNNLPVDTAE